MAELDVRLFSQEGLDAEGCLQSHQWAELPQDLAQPLMVGGLKKIRRLAEGYFSYRFSPAASRVRGVWRSGEPRLRTKLHHLPFVHGRDDKRVKLAEAQALWKCANPYLSRLHVIESAGHTFRTQHPLDKPSQSLLEAVEETVRWFQRTLPVAR